MTTTDSFHGVRAFSDVERHVRAIGTRKVCEQCGAMYETYCAPCADFDDERREREPRPFFCAGCDAPIPFDCDDDGRCACGETRVRLLKAGAR